MGLSKLFGVLDVFSELSRLESRDRNSNRRELLDDTEQSWYLRTPLISSSTYSRISIQARSLKGDVKDNITFEIFL